MLGQKNWKEEGGKQWWNRGTMEKKEEAAVVIPCSSPTKRNKIGYNPSIWEAEKRTQYTPLIPTLGRQMQVDLCESKSSLVYIGSSRQTGPHSKTLSHTCPSPSPPYTPKDLKWPKFEKVSNSYSFWCASSFVELRFTIWSSPFQRTQSA